MQPTSVTINIDYDNGTSEEIVLVTDKSLEIKRKGQAFAIKGLQPEEELDPEPETYSTEVGPEVEA